MNNKNSTVPPSIEKFWQNFAEGGENTRMRGWYIKTFPKDSRGKYIDLYNTFEDLWNSIENNKNVYNVIGEGDSLIRERLFEKLSQIKGVKYMDIYNKWLETNEDEYAKGGGIEKENAEMVLNNNKQIAHHTKELASAVKGKTVPAWVVAKVNRSATDLSDVTHYIEGTEMAKRGANIKGWHPSKGRSTLGDYANQKGTGYSKYGYQDAGLFPRAKAEFIAKKLNGYAVKDLSGEYFVYFEPKAKNGAKIKEPSEFERIKALGKTGFKKAKGGYVFKGDKYEYVPTKFTYTIGGL